ncbi:superinfection exclusion protein [Escherichia coli]|uniref:superinfection exclusion protein n=1 Tax=Escherichia coli TaxID=562 RepID=UPI0007A008D2|nr:superinfection exclusion protein [Escherichia coli]
MKDIIRWLLKKRTNGSVRYCQYTPNIKPDYCNANGLEMWDESLTDEDLSEVGLTDRWVDWYSECQCYDDPRKYLESLKEETSAA